MAWFKQASFDKPHLGHWPRPSQWPQTRCSFVHLVPGPGRAWQSQWGQDLRSSVSCTVTLGRNSVSIPLCVLELLRTSPVAQLVKNLPAVQETWVQSLGWEGPLEKEMATHSSILAWRIPWTEEPGGLQSTGSQRVRYSWTTSTFTKVTWKLLYPKYSAHFLLNSLSHHHTPYFLQKGSPGG